MARRRLLRPLRQRLELLLLRGIGALARALPFGAASDLGAWVGRVARRLLARRRRIAEENIALALEPLPGGDTPEAVAKRAFEQLGRTFLEFLALPAQPREAVLGRITWEGFDPIFERGRQGKGAVMLTGHFGNWELFGAAFGMKTGKMKYLLPAQTNAAADAYLNEVRRRLGVEPLTIGYGMRAGLRALRGGAFLGMLPDQDARRAGIHVPFFGRPASTHTGPARLAIRAGCPIAVGLMERTGPGRYHARMRCILTPDPSAPETAEVARLTALVTAAIEEGIRERPDHWYWIHRRWKTPPPASTVPAAAAVKATS